jgi:hypothetical protein
LPPRLSSSAPRHAATARTDDGPLGGVYRPANYGFKPLTAPNDPFMVGL